jgi:archaellum component FlaD/FlaE
MGLFGKRKEKAAEASAQPPPGEGIRDLSDAAPPPEPALGSDLGPPAPGSMGPPLQGPPAAPSPLGDEGDSGAPPMAQAAPPPPMAAPPMPGPAPMMQPPAAPMPPAPAFEPSPLGGGDVSMAAPAPVVQAAGGLERLDSVEQRMSDMSRRVDLLDKASDDIRNDISRIRDSIAQIEGDMRELTSLYDLISTQINPFIDTSTMEEKPAIQVEQGAIPDLDALFEPTPELAAERAAEAASAVTETVAPQGAPAEGAAAAPAEAAPSLKVPRLAKIGSDASCHLALMEWIRFLLERVNRTEIPSVLSFYQRIGWISGEIKADVVEIIRGIGPVSGEPSAPAAAPHGGGGASAAKDASGDIVIAYGKEQARDLKGPAKGQGAAAKGGPKAAEPSATWRLTPDDHIGSLMYIEWIRSGGDLDRDKLEEIRREVSRLRSGLDGFFSL